MSQKSSFVLNQMHNYTKELSLKDLLKEEGITQEQLARKFKLNRSTISRMLSNPKDISIDMLEAILSIANYNIQIVITKK